MGSKADMEIFENKGIQAIIDFKYPFIRKWIFIRLFIPFILFHITYICFNNFIEKQYRDAYEENKGKDWNT
jgi:hypothetical protein